jgi:fructose-bisphosphate aldolase, class II
MLAAVELHPKIPIAMHQDHGNSAGHLQERHRAGLHLGDDGRLADGGRQDARHYEYNVEVTRRWSRPPTPRA